MKLATDVHFSLRLQVFKLLSHEEYFENISPRQTASNAGARAQVLPVEKYLPDLQDLQYELLTLLRLQIVCFTRNTAVAHN